MKHAQLTPLYKTRNVNKSMGLGLTIKMVYIQNTSVRPTLAAMRVETGQMNDIFITGSVSHGKTASQSP